MAGQRGPAIGRLMCSRSRRGVIHENRPTGRSVHRSVRSCDPRTGRAGTSCDLRYLRPDLADRAAGVGRRGPSPNTNMWAWDEQQGVTLRRRIRVDITSPGTYTSGEPTLRPASRFPPGPSSTATTSRASPPAQARQRPRRNADVPDRHSRRHRHVRKAQHERGARVCGNQLPRTTGLGFALEFGRGHDSVTLANQRTITFHSAPGQRTGIDEIRVITKHDGAPDRQRRRPVRGHRRQHRSRCTERRSTPSTTRSRIRGRSPSRMRSRERSAPREHEHPDARRSRATTTRS